MLRTLSLMWRLRSDATALRAYVAVLQSERGEFDVSAVIGLVILALIAAAAIPIAITNIAAVNTDSWDTGSAALWGVLGLVIVAAVIFGFYKAVKN